MKKIIIPLALLCFGCSHIHLFPGPGTASDAPGAPSFCQRYVIGGTFDQCRKAQLDAEQAEDDRIHSPEYLAKVKADQEKKDLFLKRQARAGKAGTSLEEFLFCFGDPQTKEIIDGKDVLGYSNVDTPLFIIFSNNKLTSIIIDRETLRQRKEDARYSDERRRTESYRSEVIAENRRATDQAAWANILNSMKTTHTNCYASGNNLDCTSH